MTFYAAVLTVVWWLCGGFITALTWFLFGLLVLIVPPFTWTWECWKIAYLNVNPIGMEITDTGSIFGKYGCNLVCNVLWLLVFGWELALMHLVAAIICLPLWLCFIPFTPIHLKLARVSLAPFGVKLQERADRSALDTCCGGV